MTEIRDELMRILRDRQRIVGSPEARFMHGQLSASEEFDLLGKWRVILAREQGRASPQVPQ